MVSTQGNTTPGKRDGRGTELCVASFGAAKEGSPEKVAFEQRSEDGREAAPQISVRDVPGRGNSQGQGLGLRGASGVWEQ